MTIQDVHDALVSVRVAADLCGNSTGRVLSMLSSKLLRPVTIRHRRFVSLVAVERAIEEGTHDPS